MLYHIYANQTNIGDWISAKGIQLTLRGLDITELFCDVPWIDQTVARIAQAGPDDLVVIGGGGLLMNYFDSFWNELALLDNLPPLVIWGVGVCALKQESSTGHISTIRSVLKRAALVSVRDEITREAVGQNYVSDPMICPSVLAITSEPLASRGVLHVDNYATVGGQVFDFMNATCQLFATSTDRAFDRTNNRIDRAREDMLMECLDLYRSADIVVSSGLHGCIIAAAMGRKIVAVSGDRKVEGFMQGIGLADWCLDYREEHRLPTMLEDIAQQPNVSERMREVRASNVAFGQSVRMLYSG